MHVLRTVYMCVSVHLNITCKTVECINLSSLTESLAALLTQTMTQLSGLRRSLHSLVTQDLVLLHRGVHLIQPYMKLHTCIHIHTCA